MAEYCLECFQKDFGSHYKRRHVVLDWDICEGCGEIKKCVVSIRYKPLWGFKKAMREKRLARSWVIATDIEDIIFEKFFTNAIQPNDIITLDSLENITTWKKRQIKYLKKDKNELFSIERNAIRVTTDIEALTTQTKKHILKLIRRYVNISQNIEDTFAYNVGKFIDDSYYNRHELDFIDEIFDTLFEISKVDIDSNNRQVPDEKTIYLYNSINFYHFHHVAKDIFNDCLQGKLHAGNDISEVLLTYWRENRDNKLIALVSFSKKYEWFLEFNEDRKITMRCDLETNRELFIMNFINTIIYCFKDAESQNKLLKQMHIKYGLLRNKKF